VWCRDLTNCSSSQRREEPIQEGAKKKKKQRCPGFASLLLAGGGRSECFIMEGAEMRKYCAGVTRNQGDHLLSHRGEGKKKGRELCPFFSLPKEAEREEGREPSPSPWTGGKEKGRKSQKTLPSFALFTKEGSPVRRRRRRALSSSPSRTKGESLKG